MTTHHTEHDLVTVAAAAAELGLTTRTVQYWIGSGYLPAVRFGPAVNAPFYIRRSDLDTVKATETQRRDMTRAVTPESRATRGA